EQLSHARRRPNLSRMRFHGMDEGLETLVCRQQRLREQRMDGEREARQIERARAGVGGDSRAGARAVVEGEALLGLERQRRVAEPCQRGNHRKQEQAANTLAALSLMQQMNPPQQTMPTYQAPIVQPRPMINCTSENFGTTSSTT